ncbi:MAG: hypothetical protein AB1349_09095, partial [Elusimicrobiota bacterium]
MSIKIIKEKENIYQDAIEIIKKSNSRLFIIERSASLLLGARKNSIEKKYLNLIEEYLYKLHDKSDKKFIYLYNYVTTKKEMFDRKIPFEKITANFAILKNIKERCTERFIIKSFKEYGNPLIIGDREFSMWLTNPAGNFLCLSIENKRYTNFIFESYKNYAMHLVNSSIEELIHEIEPKEARESILD